RTADGGGGVLVELPGAASHRRIDRHAPGVRFGHIDFAAGIQRDAKWVFEAGLAPADGGGGGLVEHPGAASQRRIDKHTAGASVRHIDVAAGIQRDADWLDQTSVAPSDDGDGSGVTIAPLGVNVDCSRGVGDVNVPACIKSHKCWVYKAGRSGG